MGLLKQSVHKMGYRLVYAWIKVFGIYGDWTCLLFFGELPFPSQEYMDVKNKIM